MRLDDYLPKMSTIHTFIMVGFHILMFTIIFAQAFLLNLSGSVNCEIIIYPNLSGVFIYAIITFQILSLGLMMFSVYHCKNNNRRIIVNVSNVYLFLVEVSYFLLSSFIPYQEGEEECGPAGVFLILYDAHRFLIIGVLIPTVLILYYLSQKDGEEYASNMSSAISELKYKYIFFGWLIGVIVCWTSFAFILNQSPTYILLLVPLFTGFLTPLFVNDEK